MKESILFIFILTIPIQGDAQNIFGKWYGINRSGLIEFNLTTDTLKIQSVKSDLDPKGFEEENRIYNGIYKVKDRVLIIFSDKKDVTKYKAMTIFNIKDKESFEIAANGINNAAVTIEELIELSKKDTTKLIGNLVYSERYIPILRGMKSVDLMKIQDFKAFLKTFISKKEEYKIVEDNMAGTVTYQLITRTLVEMGYNPINNVDVINRQFERFKDDQEVKDLLKKI